MEIKIRTLVIRLATALIVTSFFTNTANAGMLDWLKNDKESFEAINNPWTLDTLFNDLKSQAKDEPQNIATVHQNSIFASSEHVTPVVKSKSPVAKYTVTATAYSSTPDQTDDSPFITASGSRVRDGIIATNFLPFGTIVKIPSVYGDKLFVVEDRMNRRYTTRVDIWFPEREMAIQFGKRTIVVEVVSLPQS